MLVELTVVSFIMSADVSVSVGRHTLHCGGLLSVGAGGVQNVDLDPHKVSAAYKIHSNRELSSRV